MVKLINKLDEISQDKKVIIDFFAEWCGPCKKIAPQYIELSKKYSDIDFFKCDVDENSELSEQFDVNALPTFVLLLNGKVVNKLEGADIEGLKEMIEDLNKSESVKNDDTNEDCIATQKEECCAEKKECTNGDKELCVDKSECTKEDKECCVNKNDCSKASCSCYA
jgi:thioredoxin 1